MVRKVNKTVITKEQITLTSDELEAIVLAHLNVSLAKSNVRVFYDIHSTMLNGMSIFVETQTQAD